MREWSRTELRHLADFQKGRKVEVSDYPQEGFAPYLGAEILSGGEGEYADSRRAVMASSADVLMLWDGERAGLVGKGRPGVVSSTVSRLIPRAGTNGTFLYYALNHRFDWIQGRRTGTGVPHVPKDIGRILQLDHPHNIDEQVRIVELLSIVDDAIEQTMALVAKTQQIKAGLMHDLFTRGVTPDGQLRPPREQAPQVYKESSLGWIPRDWDLLNLGSLAEIVSGVTLGIDCLSGIEVPYLRVANVQDGYLDLSEMKTVRVDPARLARLALRPGDVLMNEGGDFDKLGRGTVWSGEVAPCIHQNHVFRVRPNSDRLRSQYLAYWSQSQPGKRYFVRSSKQSTNLASINSTQLHAFPVAVPERKEQQEIERRIGAVNGQLRQLIHDATKCRQLRMGLMHDLLNGSVRVPVSTMEPIAAEA